jgi:sugar phosphate isomerase/epimerase
MKLGVSSYTYTWAIGVPGHPPERPMKAVGLLNKAATLGVRLVQVADNLPLHRLPEEDLDAFEARARDLDIDVEVGTRGMGPEHVLTYLRLAERLGSPILRVVVDTAAHHPTASEIVGTVASLLPAFERAGVTLAIENHDRFRAETLASIVERIGSEHVGVCLDTVNSFGALEGPRVVVDALGPWTVNLHVKDFTIRRASHGMGFTIEGRPAGRGRLRVPWLLGELRRLGVDPNAVLELWTPPGETLGETIAREDAWAAESVAYLRALILA